MVVSAFSKKYERKQKERHEAINNKNGTVVAYV